jgi:hypothetical protein
MWPLIVSNDVILPVLGYALVSVASICKGYSARRAWAFSFVVIGWVIVTLGALLFTMLIALGDVQFITNGDTSTVTLGSLLLLVVPLFVALYFFSAAKRLRQKSGNGDVRS